MELAQRLYLDECVQASIAVTLRESGFDVEYAKDINQTGRGWSDRAQLEYAAQAGRILVSYNRRDFRREHRKFQHEGRSHSGILLLTHSRSAADNAIALIEYLADRNNDPVDDCITLAASP